MELIFLSQGWEDYLFWQSNDKKQVKRINELIRQCLRTPFEVTGKPEPLKGNLSVWWFRRIDQENRLVYKATDNGLYILQCRKYY
jgi:toxin YoeB